MSDDANKKIREILKSSGNHQATEAGMVNAHARIFFAIFLLIVSVLVFLFGLSVQSGQPVDGAVIKSLAAVPFLGGAWHLRAGHGVLRARAAALQAKADAAASS